MRICLNAWSLVSGTILEELTSVVFSGEVCFWQWTLESQTLCWAQCLSLSLDKDVELSATAPVTCLSAFHHDDHRVTL